MPAPITNTTDPSQIAHCAKRLANYSIVANRPACSSRLPIHWLSTRPPDIPAAAGHSAMQDFPGRCQRPPLARRRYLFGGGRQTVGRSPATVADCWPGPVGALVGRASSSRRGRGGCRRSSRASLRCLATSVRKKAVRRRFRSRVQTEPSRRWPVSALPGVTAVLESPRPQAVRPRRFRRRPRRWPTLPRRCR